MKIKEQRQSIKILKKKLQSLKRVTYKSSLLHKKLLYYKNKGMGKEKRANCSFCEEQIEINEQLKEMILKIKEENAIALDRISELESNTVAFTSLANGRYSDAVRTCVMDLLTNSVPVRKVEPVMQFVLHMIGIHCS